MFTGIIETTGKVVSIEKDKSNLILGIESSFTKELKAGQSIAHNGVCLTVTSLPDASIGAGPSPLPWERGARGEAGVYYVTAVKETLSKTNLGKLKVGDEINLERSLKISDRLDGHFVQGHVDCTAVVKSIKKEKGSWLFVFRLSRLMTKNSRLIIEKGSICINGVSLTVVEVGTQTSNTKHQTLDFSVAIIPHTFSHTNFKLLKKGDEVNIEFDVLGKYVRNIIRSKD